MQTIRRSKDRGRSQRNGIDAHHSFSTGQYLDPGHMGFGPLNALDEERVAPEAGHASREYANTERLTLMLSGALAYSDNIGHSNTLHAPAVQLISTGTGMRFQNANPSATTAAHSYTAWFVPRGDGLVPSYQSATISIDDRAGRWTLLATPDGRDQSLTLSQDVLVSGASLASGTELSYPIAMHRSIWLQVIDGRIAIEGEMLSNGDGVAIMDEQDIRVVAESDARLLLFDVVL